MARRALAPISLAAALLAFAALAAPSARAQTERAPAPDSEARLDRLLERDQVGAPLERGGPLPAPETDPLAVRLRWQMFSQVTARGEPGVAQLTEIAHALHAAGAPGDAALAYAALETLSDPPARAWQAAADLAPQIPQVHWLAARRALGAGHLGESARLAARGARRAAGWPDFWVFFGAWAHGAALSALLIASMAWTLAQIARHFAALTYDASRLLPRAFSAAQTATIIVCALCIPALLARSPLLALVCLLLASTITASARERAVGVALALGLAAAPWSAGAIERAGAWLDSPERAAMLAHYAGCEERRHAPKRGGAEQGLAGAKRLAALVEGTERFRCGEASAVLAQVRLAESSIDAWPQEARAWGLNLRGAALVAVGSPREARAPLERAAPELSSPPAPTFNLMRAAQMSGDAEGARAALERANAIDLSWTSEKLAERRRDPNSMLSVPAVPANWFWAAFAASHANSGEAPPGFARLWRALAGPAIPLGAAPWLALGTAALIAALSAGLRGPRASSSPCPHCGMARDPGDAARTGRHPWCGVCFDVLVDGARLEYIDRTGAEDQIAQRARVLRSVRRLLSLALPGAGQVHAGAPLRGALGLLALGAAATIALELYAPWSAPQTLIESDPLALGAIALWLLVALYLWGAYGAVRGIASRAPRGGAP